MKLFVIHKGNGLIKGRKWRSYRTSFLDILKLPYDVLHNIGAWSTQRARLTRHIWLLKIGHDETRRKRRRTAKIRWHFGFAEPASRIQLRQTFSRRSRKSISRKSTNQLPVLLILISRISSYGLSYISKYMSDWLIGWWTDWLVYCVSVSVCRSLVWGWVVSCQPSNFVEHTMHQIYSI